MTTDEIKADIRRVLRESFHDRARRDERVFMTAYQIMSFMSDDARDALTSKYGPRSGAGADVYYSPASAVANMLKDMVTADPDEIEVVKLDVRRLKLEVEGQGEISPGSNFGCGLYRLRRP